MSKKNQRVKTRAEPKKDYATAWLCSSDAYNMLTVGDYVRLSDSPEVRMCVAIYAELISSMTLHLMQNTSDGDKRIKNELSRKLDINPHRRLTRKTFIANLVQVLMLSGDGNQVTYPHYTAAGYLDDLEPLKPSRVSFADTADGDYIIRHSGQTFSPDEVLHFTINPDPDRPWIGTGYKAVLREVLKGIRQAGATKTKLLESPSPSIIVKVDGLVEEFASIDGRKKLSKQFLDSSENGEPWFIPSENFSIETVKPLTINDLAIAKNLELDKRTVAGIFGVPAFLVGVGSYNKDEYNNFIRSRLMPFAMGIQQVLTKGLLISPDLYWQFNPRSLYAYSMQEIIAAGAAMLDRMAMRRNELRDWIGMSADPEMHELLALENFLPITQLGNQKKLKGGGDDGGNAVAEGPDD